MGTVSLRQRFHQLHSKTSRKDAKRWGKSSIRGGNQQQRQLVHQLQQEWQWSARRVQLLQCQWILLLQQWVRPRLLPLSVWWHTVFWWPGVLHPLQLQCWNSFLQDQIAKAWLDSQRSGRAIYEQNWEMKIGKFRAI